MLSSNKSPLIILLFLLLPLSCLEGQEQRHGQYDDLDLYYSLLEAEKRDSNYHKVLEEWQQSHSQRSQECEASLSFGISNRELAEKYRATITLPQQSEKETRIKTDKLISLAELAAKKKEPALELEALREAFMLAFWGKPQDYHKAFTIGFMLEEKLPRVTEEQYPCKRRTWFRLGEAYYLFLDFDKSIRLLEKALSPIPLAFDDRANLDALNILGICHANRGEWEISDSYFRATLLSNDMVLDRPLYNAYALSHLGCNAMLTGQYDKALALSSAVWSTLRQTGNKGHLAGMCYCRGKSHLAKEEFREVSQWVDSLVLFAAQDDYNKTKRVKQSYALRAQYSAAVGDARMTQAYNDTLIAIYKMEEEQLTSQYISKASQDYNEAKLSEHVRMLRISRTQLLLISLIALIATAVSTVITHLYRRNKAAYRSLVLRAREWAAQAECPPVPPVKTSRDNSGTQETGKIWETGEIKEIEEIEGTRETVEDREIMARIHREMTEGNLYRNPALTAESLAEQFGIHRNLLSRAVNRSTGHNFNQYVNSFRIKEAIRIISDQKQHDLYIDELYEKVGFNSRTSFYRAFKQKTGLSPREFQKNG